MTSRKNLKYGYGAEHSEIWLFADNYSELRLVMAELHGLSICIASNCSDV